MTKAIRDAPAFDFYPERWTHGTRGMTKIERCDYLDLLLMQWTEGALPDEETLAVALGYVSRSGKPETAKLPVKVMAKFPPGADGKRRNQLLEKLRTEQRERITKAKERSEKMHAARYSKQPSEAAASTAASSPQAVPKGCPPPTTHLPPHTPNGVRASSAGAWPGVGEVKAEAVRLMVPPECAEKFWNDSEAAGWVNRHGQPLSNWRPLFANFATAWKANDAQRRKSSAPQARQQRPSDKSDVDPKNMREL